MGIQLIFEWLDLTSSTINFPMGFWLWTNYWLLTIWIWAVGWIFMVYVVKIHTKLCLPWAIDIYQGFDPRDSDPFCFGKIGGSPCHSWRTSPHGQWGNQDLHGWIMLNNWITTIIYMYIYIYIRWHLFVYTNEISKFMVHGSKFMGWGLLQIWSLPLTYSVDEWLSRRGIPGS